MFGLLFFTCVIAYFAYLFWERWQQFQLREKLGLKGPKASMLLGNMDYFIKRTKELGYDDGYEQMARWTEEYGETFAIYISRYLQIVTTNEDFVREVYIKQFSKFGNRCIPKIFEENAVLILNYLWFNNFKEYWLYDQQVGITNCKEASNKPEKWNSYDIKYNISKGLNDSLVQMSRENGWKDVRACMTAQFSTGKMRMMYETVKDKIDLFITILDEKKGQTFDIYE